MPTTTVRWGVAGALLAAAALAFSGLVALLSRGAVMGPEGSRSWLLSQSGDATASLGVLVALLALNVLQGRRSGRVGAAGTWIAGAGSALMVVSIVVYLLPLTVGVLLDVLFFGALVGWLAGLPLVGVGAWRGRVVPRWCAVLIGSWSPLFAAAFMVVDASAGARGPFLVLLALPWLAVTYALRSLTPARMTPREPVRAG